MIKFRCSGCHKKFGVPDGYAGHRIRCNTCSQHTFVPGLPAQNKSVGQPPQAGHDSSGDQLLTAEDLFRPLTAIPVIDDISDDDKPLELLSEPQEHQMQLQSFHNYQQPEAEADQPAPKKLSPMKLCKPAPEESRTESILDITSLISCIGPVLFIIMFFHIISVIAIGNPRAHSMPPADPNIVSTSVPNAVATAGSISILPTSPVFKYTFIAFSFVISPIALIASLILMFRYSLNMPKILYFSIVVHGLIFFNIFRG